MIRNEKKNALDTVSMTTAPSAEASRIERNLHDEPDRTGRCEICSTLIAAGFWPSIERSGHLPMTTWYLKFEQDEQERIIRFRLPGRAKPPITHWRADEEETRTTRTLHSAALGLKNNADGHDHASCDNYLFPRCRSQVIISLGISSSSSYY